MLGSTALAKGAAAAATQPGRVALGKIDRKRRDVSAPGLEWYRTQGARHFRAFESDSYKTDTAFAIELWIRSRPLRAEAGRRQRPAPACRARARPTASPFADRQSHRCRGVG